jgi:hypothetical protein
MIRVRPSAPNFMDHCRLVITFKGGILDYLENIGDRNHLGNIVAKRLV